MTTIHFIPDARKPTTALCGTNILRALGRHLGVMTDLIEQGYYGAMACPDCLYHKDYEMHLLSTTAL